MKDSKYIRFDWAIKRLLRDKANFVVLEGFLTTLLERNIKINRLLESEGNQEDEYDKYNRVDMLAEDTDGELMLIEVQTTTYNGYFHRMLYGTSKLITEYITKGEPYDHIKKVYSINVAYFPLGTGTDYIYHGTTEFRGMNKGDLLGLSAEQQERFGVKAVSDIYPEYFVIKVNDFDKVARTPLDEWVLYLKTGDIPEKTNAPGLEEARRRLLLDQMSPAERESYYRHIDKEVMSKGSLEDSYYNGHFRGLREGLQQGRQLERMAIVKQLMNSGLSPTQIATALGMDLADVERMAEQA